MLIVLSAELKNIPRGYGRRYRAVKREALREVAWYWHARILHRHFTPGNSSRYRMKMRNKLYRQEIKIKQGEGQGRFVDLILKGRSLRWMRAFASVTATGTQSTLRMKTPAYFTKPFVGSWTDPETGRRRVITQQPDKPGEVKQISTDDRADMSRFLRRGIVRGFKTGAMPSGKSAAN